MRDRFTAKAASKGRSSQWHLRVVPRRRDGLPVIGRQKDRRPANEAEDKDKPDEIDSHRLGTRRDNDLHARLGAGRRGKGKESVPEMPRLPRRGAGQEQNRSDAARRLRPQAGGDRKSTRLNPS